MSPLVFAVVCLASMTVLGGTEEQPIRLEQGLLVLFHTVLVLQIESRCSLVRLFTIYVAPGTMLHTMISHQHHTGDYWSNLVCPQAIYFLLSLSRSPVSARFNPARGMHSPEHSGVERGKDQNTSSLARSIAQRKITLWTDCRSNRISAASVS